MGRDPVFFALDEALPIRNPIDRTEALARLARRYFTSHGPATLRDFVWWSGLKVSDARKGLEAVLAELEHVTVEGRDYWRSPEETLGPAPTSVAFLLPAYDEFVVGYQDRSATLAPQYAALVKNANGLGASVLYDGQVIGTWTREVKRAGVTIHTVAFAPWPDPVQQAVREAAAHYGAFIGQSAVLNVRA